MNNTIKILVIGLGSIGERHILNMSEILTQKGLRFQIDVLRHNRKKTIDEHISKLINAVYYDSEEISDVYDVVFITNSTHLHYETLKKWVNRAKHFFIEKPVFSNSSFDIKTLGMRDENIYYVACPLRYTKVIQYLKNKLDPSEVISVRAISSSYLPEWRPNIDYRTVYSAQDSQGGGVSIDLIHEWDYLQYLFGFPIEVMNFRGKFSELEIASDDLSIYIARYDKHLVELHLDYFGRMPIRELTVFTNEDTIKADLINSEIKFLKSGETISFNEGRNEFQKRELEFFFNLIEKPEVEYNSIDIAVKTLRLTEEGKHDANFIHNMW